MNNYITGHKVFDTVKKAQHVADYVVARLVDLGITHAFSIPGDFAFTIDRALINNGKLENIVSANELNASYAADGYARVRGAAILSTTYAVGELSALNGVMGAKAENNIIFHLVGFPNHSVISKRQAIHHTLGDGDFNQFYHLSAAAACVSAVITPDNARREMNRVIYEAFKFRQPAYITISIDDGAQLVTDKTNEDFYHPSSNPEQLSKAITLILERLQNSAHVVIVPSLKLDRFHLTHKALGLIEALNVPFVIMPHDKSVLSEYHPLYAGFYAGALSDPGTAEMVENADLVINLGDALWSDFNTGLFTNYLDNTKVLNLGMTFVNHHDTYLANVYLSEVLEALIPQIKSKTYLAQYQKPVFAPLPITKAPITLETFYSQLIHFLQQDDVLVVETGSSSINTSKLPLPEGVKYHNQTLWGSIGWATPATLGIALADPVKRAILVTGEGAHQMTLNELGIMGRYHVKPILFCINNNGFMVERALEADPNPSYDDLAQLNYRLLPGAFGCDHWLSLTVKNQEELASALIAARQQDQGVYIEVITAEQDYGTALSFYRKKLLGPSR